MRVTAIVDGQLFKDAQELTGVTSKSALVRIAIKELVEREAASRLARLGGSSPGIKAPPRRRPPYFTNDGRPPPGGSRAR